MRSEVGQKGHSSHGHRRAPAPLSFPDLYDEDEPNQPRNRKSVDEFVDVSNQQGNGRRRNRDSDRTETKQRSHNLRSSLRDGSSVNAQASDAYLRTSADSQSGTGGQSSNRTKRSPYRYEREDRAHRTREGVKTSTSNPSRVPVDAASSTSTRTSSRYHSSSLPPRAPTPPQAARSSNIYTNRRTGATREEPLPYPTRSEESAPSFVSSTNAIPSRTERLRSRAKVKKDGTWKLGAFAAVALTAYIVFEKRRKRRNRNGQMRRDVLDQDIDPDDDIDIWAFAHQNPDIIEDPLPRTRSPRPYSGRVPEEDDIETLGMPRRSASQVSFVDTPEYRPTPPPDGHVCSKASCGAGPSRQRSRAVGSARSDEPQIGPGALVVHQGPNNAAKAASCIVCDSDVAPLKRRSPTSRCNASCTVCMTCMSQWLETQIQSGDWQNTRCPNCSNTLTSTDIKHFTSKKVYARYTTLANRAHFSAIPSFRWCLSPTCNSGQIHNGGTDAPIFRCIECGHKSCIVHNRAWHEGETCKQFDERTDGRKRLRDEQASMRVVGQTTKICPGTGCGWRVTKISGCDHMTCSQCKHEFCWLCMADYKRIRTTGNSIHMENCPHHTNNVR